jgi:serine O-acetyltransferase
MHEQPALLDLIREDYRAHGCDWSLPGWRALAAYRFTHWTHTAVHGPISGRIMRRIGRFVFRVMRNRYGIEIPPTARIGRRVVIEHQSGIVIHGGASIGDDCVIRQNVTIGNRHLDRPFDAPQIGARVNIGAGAVLIGAIKIGSDVNIGANTVVVTDVPDGATVVGAAASIKFARPQTVGPRALDIPA